MVQRLDLDRTYTDTNTHLNTEAKAEVSKEDNTLWAFVNAAVGGGGYAESRLYTEFSPIKSKSYEVSAEYFRDGDFLTGKGEIFIVTNNSFEGLNKYKLEERKTSISGNTTRSAEINLKDTRTYDIGFEIRTSGTAFLTVTFPDFYNSKSFPPGSGPRHRVELNEFRIQ